MTENLVQTLDDIESLIDLLGEALPGPSVGLLVRPAPIRAAENLFIARRTVGSVRVLMLGAANGEDEDRTEDAAALVRKLLELWADTYWISQEGVDPDAQALRSLLRDIDEQQKKCNRAVEMAADEKTVAQAQTRLDEIDNELAEIHRQLADSGASTNLRPPVGQILREADENLAFYWSFESDAAHAGMIGRSLQSGGEIAVGQDAPSWRQGVVTEMAFSLAVEIFERSMHLMGLPDDLRQQFVDGVRRLPTVQVLNQLRG